MGFRFWISRREKNVNTLKYHFILLFNQIDFPLYLSTAKLGDNVLGGVSIVASHFPQILLQNSYLCLPNKLSIIITKLFSGTNLQAVSEYIVHRYKTHTIEELFQSKEHIQWFYSTLHNPRSLQSECRLSIRAHIGRRLTVHINTLPLPRKLKLYLQFKDLAGEFDV